jgi:hypothetical protein
VAVPGLEGVFNIYKENLMIENIHMDLKEWRDKLEEMRGYL